MSAKRDEATPKVYEIRTLADFLNVPEKRRGVCLREFRLFLEISEATRKLLQHVSDEMHPGALQWRTMDVFRWSDDGKRNVTINIPQAAEPAASDSERAS